MFDQISILAPGLLGTSLGLAVKKAQLARKVIVWGRRPEVRLRCAKESWCDGVCESPEEAARSADLVLICSPVQSIAPLLRQIVPALGAGAIVSDVGSTKSLVTRQCHAAMAGGSFFVGSHPMAGSEKSGMAHARPDLFRGKVCFVTPLPDTDSAAVESVLRFWIALEMEPVTLSPEAHDEIVANISHLPHLLASVLCQHLSRQNPDWAAYAGPGLKDTVRIASGSPGLWKEIIAQNREEILRALSAFENELQSFKSQLANQNYLQILHALEKGKSYCDQLRPPLSTQEPLPGTLS